MNNEFDLASVDQEWLNMLDGLVEEPLRGQLLAHVVAGVNAAVRREAEAGGLVEALRRILDVPLISSALWPEVDRCVGLTLGRDGVRLLTWLVAVDVEIESRLNEVAETLVPEAASSFRGILARYGDVLARAFYMWNFISAEDDWRSVNWDTVQAVGINRYTTRVNLRKFNGEEIVFTGRPDGMVLLIRVLGEALMSLPAVAFGSREEMERLQQTVRTLTDKVLDGEPAEAPDGERAETPDGELSQSANPDGDLPISR